MREKVTLVFLNLAYLLNIMITSQIYFTANMISLFFLTE